MSSIATSLRGWLLAVGLCVAFCASGGGLPAGGLQDPVLGLRYLSKAVSFEALPAEVLAQCPALSDEHWLREASTYGHVEDDGHSYYVMGGLYLRRPGAPRELPRSQVDTQGAVLDIHEGRCDLLGPAREVFDSRPREMPPAALDRLADDLLARYITAFGGHDGLRKAMRRQGVHPNAMQGALPEAFKRAGWRDQVSGH